MSFYKVVAGAIMFGLFFWIPFGEQYLAQKQGLRIVGSNVLPFFFPIIAIAGLYQSDWEMGLSGLIMSVGYFSGLWWFHKKRNR